MIKFLALLFSFTAFAEPDIPYELAPEHLTNYEKWIPGERAAVFDLLMLLQQRDRDRTERELDALNQSALCRKASVRFYDADQMSRMNGFKLEDAPLYVRNFLMNAQQGNPLMQAGEYEAIVRYRFDNPTLGSNRELALRVLLDDRQSDSDMWNTSGPEMVQDFLSIDHPSLPVVDAMDYRDLQRIVVAEGLNKVSAFFRFALPRVLPHRWSQWHGANLFKLWMRQRSSSQSPLGQDYYSATPYLVGHQPLKFSLSPCDSFPDDTLESDRSRGAAKSLVLSRMREKNTCFYLRVQPISPDLVRNHEGAISQYIENGSRAWDEKQWPYYVVGRVDMLKMELEDGDDADGIEDCSRLSFNPWRGMRSIRPIGNVNRAMGAVIESIHRGRD